MIESFSKQQKVTFAYSGPLQSRGRMLKQIATLQENDVECNLLLGNTDTKDPDPGDYSFSITSKRVNIYSGKIKSFIDAITYSFWASKKIIKGKSDTIVCMGIGPFLAGVLAKRRRPTLRLVFDNNELRIEAMESALQRIVWRPIHNYCVARCDLIFHAEINRMNYFKKHYPGSDKPQLIIENFPSYQEDAPKRLPPGDEVRVIYLGGIGEGRFTKEIINAFSCLSPSIRLDIVGFGRPKFIESLKEHLDALGVSHVRILPGVPYAEIPALLANYHIGVALYKNTNLNNYYCAPNKVYDYLMNGMPVITNRYPGLVSVIETNRVGFCIDEVTTKELGKAINLIREERRWENITPELRKRYCWESQVPRYLDIFGITSSH